MSGGLTIPLPAELLDAIVARVAERVLADLAERDALDGAPAFLNVDEAARYLGVSPERVRKLVARAGIPYFQEAPGCRVTFSRRDLDQWMNGFRREARR